MTEPQQLLLPIQPLPHQCFAGFADTGNTLALDACIQLAKGHALSPRLFLHGAEGCGKTHLLHATCNRARESGANAIYLDLASRPPLDGLEQLQLVALDQVHRITDHADDQEALFHLLNRCENHDCRLLLASRLPPAAITPCLPDLRSRLQAFHQLAMKLPDDAGLDRVTRHLSQWMQMHCSEALFRHLQLHGPRNPHERVALLFKLARHSLRRQRKPTVALLRELMCQQN